MTPAIHFHADSCFRRMNAPLILPGALFYLIATTMITATSAWAHSALSENINPWTAWNVTPDIALGTILVMALYFAGAWRQRRKANRARTWRHVFFLTGLAVLFLALQSPIDPVAERTFFVHQIQHLLLRMIGPMLIILSFPQGSLVAGTPGWLQRRIAAPFITSRVIRGGFGFVAHPVMTTALFIGALYFWQIPKIHSVALLNDYMHYLMHVSLIFTGFLFFWRIFDARPAPVGTGYGVRLMMLWLVALSNIAIGSYLTLKRTVLYPVYDVLGRLGGQSAMVDEQIGGIIIWIPGSMMVLLAVLIVVHMWGRKETKDDHRRVAKLARHGYGWNAPPMTGAELIAQAASKNQSMAFGFVGFVLSVFTAAIMVGVIYQMLGT